MPGEVGLLLKLPVKIIIESDEPNIDLYLKVYGPLSSNIGFSWLWKRSLGLSMSKK